MNEINRGLLEAEVIEEEKKNKGEGAVGGRKENVSGK